MSVIAILAGGLSHERDVSIRSGRRVSEALRSHGHEASVLDIDSNLLDRLDRLQPDVVWPLLHGSIGEDGSIQAVLETVGVPFVGSPSGSCRLGWDKSIAKVVAQQNGIATPRGVALPQSLFRDLGAQGVLDKIMTSLDLPLVVKPARGGSALGVSLVRSGSDFSRAMIDCFAYGSVALIEQAIEGIELAVSVVETDGEPMALPPVEIVTDGPYDFDARYNPGRSEYFAPARASDDVMTAAQEAGVRVHQILGLRHLSRSDLIVDANGTPWLLDVNVSPGQTETSLFPLAVQASGEELGICYARIAQAALP